MATDKMIEDFKKEACEYGLSSLNERPVQGSIRYVGPLAHTWVDGWFRLDSMVTFIWYRPKRKGSWKFITDVSQVLEFKNWTLSKEDWKAYQKKAEAE